MKKRISETRKSKMERRTFLKKGALAATVPVLGAGYVTGTELESKKEKQFPAGKKFDVCGILEPHSWIWERASRPNRDKDQSEWEALLDAHYDLGFKQVSLSLGRSVVTYQSENPLVTMFGREADQSQMRQGDLEFLRIIQKEDMLKTSVSYGHKKGMTIYATLFMNRHYSGGLGNCMTSMLARRPELREIGIDGEPDGSRLCFALEDYQQERLAIIDEATRSGIDGICLDFVRQPPMLRYHPALTEAYKKDTGNDPPKLRPYSLNHLPKDQYETALETFRKNGMDNSGAEPEEFMAWCKYRADVLTGFMRRARQTVNKVEVDTGRRIELIARIVDDGFTANLISGPDIETWCQEGLIDTVMVNPLQWIHGIWIHDVSPYVELGRRTGVKVYGGANTYAVQRGFLFNPVRIAQRIKEQYDAGAAGISLYETNDAVMHPVLYDLLHAIHDYDDLAALLSDQDWLKQWPISGLDYNCGMDNHSGRPRFNLLET